MVEATTNEKDQVEEEWDFTLTFEFMDQAIKSQDLETFPFHRYFLEC